MPSRVERVVGSIVERNNIRLGSRALDAGAANPRPSTADPWRARLERRHPVIRSEWDAFVDGGRRLPRIEQLISEDQGNEGAWRAGLIVHSGRPVPTFAARFPATIEALADVPGLRFALWSVLEAGTELPEHRGPNGGVLRLHLGVDCPPNCALRVGDDVVPYSDGSSILFDDTERHAAWNRSDRDRVTLFCELERPASGLTSAVNRCIQRGLALDPRYRGAASRAVEWDRALNG